MLMNIEYDKPIEVNEVQYNHIMHRYSGIVAGRKEGGKFFIKVWFMKYAHLIQTSL